MFSPNDRQLYPQIARIRINVLCWYYPALLGERCGEKRLARAAYLASTSVVQQTPNTYKVHSQSDNRKSYIVDTEEKTCTCPDHRAGYICKHRIAVAAHTTAPSLIAQLKKEKNPQDAEEVFRGSFIPAEAY